MKKYLAISLLSGSLLLGWATGGRGQADSSAHRVPRLGGHRFMFHPGVEDPFLKTNLELNLGLGEAANFAFPILELEDERVLAFKGEILFASGRLAYTQNIRDWVGVYVSTDFSGRLGTSLGSLLVQGLNYIGGFHAGWLFRIGHGEKWILTASTGISKLEANFVNISELVSGPDTTQVRLSGNVPAMYGNLGIRSAWAINDLLGLTASGRLGIGESFGRGDARLIYHLGILMDLDLYARTKAPIGFGLAASITTVPELVYVDFSSAQSIFFRIAYTGSSEFQLGLDVGWSLLPTEVQKERLKSGSLKVSSRYFF